MKTLEEKVKETKDYIQKSSEHLFVVNDIILTKVIPFTKEDTLYYAKLTIVKDKVYLDIHKNYDDGCKWRVKNRLFPAYVKTKSIPYFKKMRELVKMIEAEISVTDNVGLIEKISHRVHDLQQVKAE